MWSTRFGFDTAANCRSLLNRRLPCQSLECLSDQFTFYNMTRRIIPLTEYETVHLERAELTDADAQLLWRRFGQQVAVEPPSFKNGQCWQLTAQGWVGFIALSQELGLALLPKAPLRNLFGMLATAYDLRSVHFGPELFQVETLPGFYEQLALLLARGILERGRRGLYSMYVDRAEWLPVVRGRLDAPRMVGQPTQMTVPCQFQEQTRDVDENRILFWTLHQLLRSGLCTEQTLPTVRCAYRLLANAVTLQPCRAEQCHHRHYDRLNRDYQPLHALCAFFLRHVNPSLDEGAQDAPAFLVNSEQLFERFVHRWLATHLATRPSQASGHDLHLAPQVRYDLADELHFRIDLALFDGSETICVMDTKYKVPIGLPATADVQQVLAYAHAVQARQAVLVYPLRLARPLDITIHGIRVRSAFFDLNGDLEAAGRAFVEQIGAPSG
ncbi:MAG: hypothetical protein R3A44_15690 [Caldilineaceae bacterium]